MVGPITEEGSSTAQTLTELPRQAYNTAAKAEWLRALTLSRFIEIDR